MLARSPHGTAGPRATESYAHNTPVVARDGGGGGNDDDLQLALGIVTSVCVCVGLSSGVLLRCGRYRRKSREKMTNAYDDDDAAGPAAIVASLNSAPSLCNQ